jgi:glycogen debranching enzyme
MGTDKQNPIDKQIPEEEQTSFYPDATEYVIDTRPLCEGAPFLLTDAAHPRLVLKHGSHFLVMDQSAAIPGCNTLGYGYYRYDTRHISQWEMTLNDALPSLLSAALDEGYAGTFLYTNAQSDSLPQQKITIQRDIVLADLLWENFTIRNFHNESLSFTIKFKFGSDFADMFEVRGLNRPTRGSHMVPLSDKHNRNLFLAYKGQDNVLLETEVKFIGLIPSKINPTDGEVFFSINLEAHQTLDMQICISSRWDGKVPCEQHHMTNFWQVKAQAQAEFQEWNKNICSITTDDQLFNLTLQAGKRDLYILRQPTPKGQALAAGVPWYCAVFGRDSAITAWQVLPFIPELSKECISVLAAYQGVSHNNYKEEEPGKIMHELRLGELARSNQIPHTPYYGTVDATALWLFLLGQYIDWTGDLEFATKLWPNVEAGLGWLENSLSGGYLTYKAAGSQSLVNQGWKDSHDSVIFNNGTLADAPIALCEAQGYLYAAWMSISRLADLLGHFDLARKLAFNADQLKKRFYKDFWMEDQGFIALALDGHRNKVDSITSNPGHLLFTGILDSSSAELVANRLIADDLYSGWGIRTVSNKCLGYNPMSYHNGTVWPHDNAIIADGLRKVGRIDDVHRIMQDLCAVTRLEPEFRLPELICGFQREQSARPIDYPVACTPQAWAAGSIFQLLNACLNLQADACSNVIRIVDPRLPEWLQSVIIRDLRIGKAFIDLSFTKSDGLTSCRALNKRGSVKVIVEI